LLTVVEALVDLLADGARQTGDFAGTGHRRKRDFLSQVCGGEKMVP